MTSIVSSFSFLWGPVLYGGGKVVVSGGVQCKGGCTAFYGVVRGGTWGI